MKKVLLICEHNFEERLLKEYTFELFGQLNFRFDMCHVSLVGGTVNQLFAVKGQHKIERNFHPHLAFIDEAQFPSKLYVEKTYSAKNVGDILHKIKELETDIVIIPMPLNQKIMADIYREIACKIKENTNAKLIAYMY